MRFGKAISFVARTGYTQAESLETSSGQSGPNKRLTTLLRRCECENCCQRNRLLNTTPHNRERGRRLSPAARTDCAGNFKCKRGVAGGQEKPEKRRIGGKNGGRRDPLGFSEVFILKALAGRKIVTKAVFHALVLLNKIVLGVEQSPGC